MVKMKEQKMGLKEKVDDLIAGLGLTMQPHGTARMEFVPDSDHVDDYRNLSRLLGERGITVDSMAEAVNGAGIPAEIAGFPKGAIPQGDLHAFQIIEGYF